MANKYLDNTGLAYFWSKIKSHFVKGNARVFYGTCDTAAATVEKEVTCPDFASSDLIPGAIITVKFDYTNSGAVASITLNVNDTGAKHIKYIYNGSYSNIPSSGYIKANQVYQFTYDGAYWVVELNYNTNSDTTYTLYYARPKAGPGGLFPYCLFMRTPDGRYSAFTTSGGTGTSKVKNAIGFELGNVYYHWHNSTHAENAVEGSNNAVCESYGLVDITYSSNIGSTLTENKPVYVVGTIGLDGLFYLDDDWITQTTPSSVDGKVYIYLGIAYDKYRLHLEANNPVYKYVDGSFRLQSLDANTVGGHTVNKDVPSDAKFTDTVTTVSTSGSGNAVTAISASNGALTVTKGTTFLTQHQDISGKADKSATVSTVAWDSTNKKLTKTIDGTTSDVVTAATLRTGLNVADGAEVNQNAFSNVKVGSTTVAADTKTDTLELAAGSNVTITPDATNDKITIAATDTTYESKAAASGGTAVSLVTTGEKYTWNNKSTVPTNHASTATTYGAGSSSNYGHVKLSESTSSTSGASGGIAATPSAVKTAYDLANTANTTANSALSGVNGNLIYDHTFTISNGVATFTPHVYQKGTEVTSNYAANCFTWKYRLINGTEVTIATKSDRGCDVTISNMGYGGHVIGIFTPPA